MKPIYIRLAVFVVAALVVALSPKALDFDSAVTLITGLIAGLAGPDVAKALGAKQE